MATDIYREYAHVTTGRDVRGVIDSHTDYLLPSAVDPWIQDCLHRAGLDGEPIVANVTINFKDGTASTWLVNVEPPVGDEFYVDHVSHPNRDRTEVSERHVASTTVEDIDNE